LDVAAPATVGIDDDLATGEAGIALRSANDEAAGRVNEILGLLRQHPRGDDLLDDVFDEIFFDLRVLHVRRVLRGNDHVHDLDGRVVFIADRDLRLGVGTEPGNFARLADLRQLAAETVRKHDRRRHELGRLVARVTEHDALVAGALLRGLFALGLLRVDALGNIRRLAREVIVDENGVGVKHVVVVHVADVANGSADDRFVVQLRLRGDLAGDDHHVGLHHGFAGDAAEAILRQAGIEDAVGDQVSDLIGVTLANGFGGENK
jgi:hypothetical protein